MANYTELANLIFPEVSLTIADLEKRYPERKLKEGAIVTRFAPSPTGYLHTGGLFSSLISYRLAMQTNGVFFLRIEDTDQKREIEGAGELLVRELSKFSIYPTEGYQADNIEKGIYGPYKQSDRAEIYKVVIKDMISRGLAYPCFCTQEEMETLRIAQENEKLRTGYYGKYAKCRHLTVDEQIERIKNNESFVIRFKSHGNEENKVHVKDLIRGELDLTENDQDIVIYKSDGLPTYHFAHLVDDHFMRTTHVIRGEEWLSSLPIHIELFNTMNWQLPFYAHLPVIMKLEDGRRRKLSKRKDPEAAVGYFLESGYPANGIVEYLLTIANSNYEEWRSQNMDKEMFDFILSFDKISLDGALFDMAKIQNICKERLSILPTEIIAKNAYSWAEVYSKDLYDLINRDYDYFKKIMSIDREKENPRKDYEKYSDIFNAINFFYDDFFDESLKEELPFPETLNKEEIKNILHLYLKNIKMNLGDEEWLNDLKALGLNMNYAPSAKEYKKNKEQFKGHIGDFSGAIRVAVTGRKNCPNLYMVLEILGKEKIVERINKVLAII